MRLAVFGATSQIAKDLLLSFAADSQHELVLYARRPQAVLQWLNLANLAQSYKVVDFEAFTKDEHFDAILNFVGVGNPAQAAAMGASIFDVTLKYDELALDYVREHQTCRYIFLSSGAAYGSSFDAPANANTKASFDLNHLQPQDWYGAAKLHAECRHRALAPLPIVDLRVFNYFSHTQDMSARFLMTDLFRAIRDKTVLQTSAAYMVRDYMHPSDFYRLVRTVLAGPAINAVFDCYSKAPVDKPTLLAALQENFDLDYELQQAPVGVNATGIKPHYYSINTRAADFGYKPLLTSLDGLQFELDLALDMSRSDFG